MNREKLNLTKKEAEEIVLGLNHDFVKIQHFTVDKSKWSITREIVVLRKNDGRYFKDTYKVNPESGIPYEHTDPNFTEVFPVTKTIITYE